MPRSRYLFLVITAGLILSETNAVRAQQGLPSQSLLNRYGLEILWSSQAVINVSRDKINHVVLDEETVYVQTRNGFVTAFDSQTGIRRWAQLVGNIDSPQLPLVSNSDTVLVTSGIRLYAMDKWTGSELWEVAIPEAAGTSPVMDDSRVFIASQHGSVYAFDLEKIYELYHQNRLPQWSHLARLWRHKTSKPIAFRPVLYGDQLTFVSETGVMYSVKAKNDQLVFQQTTELKVAAPLVESESYLFVATDDNHLYCLDKERGTLQWHAITRSRVRNTPTIIYNRCYLTTVDGTLYCFDKHTGVELWTVPNATSFVAKTNSYIVSEDTLGSLLLLSPDSTESEVTEVGRLPFREFKFKAQNSLTDRIYLVTEQGLVVCLRERGDSFPVFFKNPERRPIEPIFVDESELAAPGNGENPQGQ